MSSDEETDVAAAIIVADHMDKRKVWTEEWLLKRYVLGSYASLFNDLRMNPKIFRKYLHLPIELFDLIVEKVKPSIERMDTAMRSAIPVGARVEATLLYLVEGIPCSRLQFSTRISESALGQIIPKTAAAIYAAFVDEFYKVSLYRYTLMVNVN